MYMPKEDHTKQCEQYFFLRLFVLVKLSLLSRKNLPVVGRGGGSAKLAIFWLKTAVTASPDIKPKSQRGAITNSKKCLLPVRERYKE